MPVTREHLARVHPHFADETHHPDDRIEFWSGIAATGLPAERFNGPVERAHALYVAQQLALEAHKRVRSRATFSPGGRRRYVVYDSDGILPKEFDTPATERPTAGAWNETSFGHALHRMARY